MSTCAIPTVNEYTFNRALRPGIESGGEIDLQPVGRENSKTRVPRNLEPEQVSLEKTRLDLVRLATGDVGHRRDRGADRRRQCRPRD